MTRREVNAAMGGLLATLFSGAAAGLRAEAAAPQQSSQGNVPPGPARGVTPLLTQSIGNLGEAEASVLILTLRPNNVSTPHKHPGPVFAYVLEGRIENQVDPEEPKTYNTGDSWYEPAMHVHRSLRNLSDTEQARVLVFMVVPKGSPSVLPGK